MTDPTTLLIITIATFLFALGVGLYVRYLLVRRLKKTVLDKWLIQTLGFFVIIPPIIVGIIVIPFINGWSSSEIANYWNFLAELLQGLLHIPDYKTLISNLIRSAIIIIFAIGIGRTLVKLATRGQTESLINVNVRLLLGRISYIIILVFAFFLILNIWDIAFAIPAATLSVLTVGLAFVIQDILKNFAAGIYILLEGPFRIGDRITTDKYTGKVEDVQLRATKLRIGNGEQAIVPNAILFSDIVINKTFYKENRATIIITMRQEDFEIDETAECILKATKVVNGIAQKPEPELRLIGTAGSFGGATGTTTGYTDRIITLALRFWFPEGQDSIIIDAMVALRTALPHADLTISEGL